MKRYDVLQKLTNLVHSGTQTGLTSYLYFTPSLPLFGSPLALSTTFLEAKKLLKSVDPIWLLSRVRKSDRKRQALGPVGRAGKLCLDNR